MRSSTQDLAWNSKAEYLKSLMVGINKLNGTINCGRVTLRLDKYLRSGKNLKLPPLSIKDANLIIDDILETSVNKVRIVRSKTKNKFLLQRCVAPSIPSNERVDLTAEDKEIFELDFEGFNNPKEEIYLHESTANEIAEELKNLPKRKADKTSFGFVFYSLENDIKAGHVSNFFVDAEDRVYFLDAQEADQNTWVSATLPTDGYRSEVFYLQSVPDEGYIIKQEMAEEKVMFTSDTIKTLSPIEKGALFQEAVNVFNQFNNNEIDELKLKHINLVWAGSLCVIETPGINPEVRTTALKMLHKMGELKHEDSLRSLAIAYFFGSGDIKDEIKGVDYFEKLHVLNPKNEFALQGLACAYFNGQGVKQDEVTGFGYCKQLYVLNANNKSALEGLGLAYYNGRGIEKNAAEGINYFEKILKIDPSNQIALEYIGLAYLTGYGKEKSANAGREYLWKYSKFHPREAFEAFNRMVIDHKKIPGLWFLLSECYQFGRGTEIDLIKAGECSNKGIDASVANNPAPFSNNNAVINHPAPTTISQVAENKFPNTVNRIANNNLNSGATFIPNNNVNSNFSTQNIIPETNNSNVNSSMSFFPNNSTNSFIKNTPPKISKRISPADSDNNVNSNENLPSHSDSNRMDIDDNLSREALLVINKELRVQLKSHQALLESKDEIIQLQKALLSALDTTKRKSANLSPSNNYNNYNNNNSNNNSAFDDGIQSNKKNKF